MPAEISNLVDFRMRRLQPISIALYLSSYATAVGAVRPDYKLNYVVRDYLIKKKEYSLSGLKISKGRRYYRSTI